jgi:hypothetical protein
MGKLTKQQAKQHLRACELVALQRPLDEEEQMFVLEHWRESSTAVSSLEGAFFTPLDLARDFALQVWRRRIIDLCAGTGRLSWACRSRFVHDWERPPTPEFVCVEKNPAYVAVGRRVLPEATWICADICDLAHMDLGAFGTAIANPPFGRMRRNSDGPRYRGPLFEYHVIDLAADLARRGVFLVPQSSAPFRCSGRPGSE